jgi:Putative cyclase
VSGAQRGGPGNDAGLGYMCEYVLSTSHSGAHIDALAHMTIGEDDHWFCGTARTHLGDFGPTAGDATAIPPIWTRGVLFDVPRYRASILSDVASRSRPTNWRP